MSNYYKGRGEHSVSSLEQMVEAKDAEIAELKNIQTYQTKLQEKLTEAINDCDAKDLEITQLTSALERFCTLSNGLSIYCRDTCLSEAVLKFDENLHLRIATIYDHQCNSEELIQNIKGGR